eukprot:Gb_31900 [translate_table: standard]
MGHSIEDFCQVDPLIDVLSYLRWNFMELNWMLNKFWHYTSVPARAAAAAAVARALAGVPPHQRLCLPSTSEGLASLYVSGPPGQKVEKLEEDFYEEVLLNTFSLWLLDGYISLNLNIKRGFSVR